MTSAGSLESLLLRIQRIEDINEIHIMGRRAYHHLAGRHNLEVDELQSSQDAVVFETEDVGAWTSLKTIKESYVEKNPFPSGTKGLLVEHTITTPAVEISGCDVPKAHWSWGRYAVGFRKEDGKWKIWHLNVPTMFRTAFDDTGQDCLQEARVAAQGW
ncbi:hypothetical protein BGZ61DRAFT_535219 [Ilyonectria robusta]|uniref:uncharacterized protein n=1 Tax=Ilyonectria robusta TaxID=1079257 RepID=UPI001E8EB93D|nr:uncharacterized protein BGZ61DRAFT_535219 [Ilyonectria robusta]KAH8680135.1 hypothetical protein BGZ61DRAFT_535219 [Ilyonectria robusta]